MGCFIVPAAEAVITTVVTQVMKSKERKMEKSEIASVEGEFETVERIPFSRKMSWLNRLLWGGSALLAFEHVWHGEVIPWFPFLTSAANPSDTAEMLREMSTVGVGMAALVTLVWAGMVAASTMIGKRAPQALSEEK